MEKQKLTDHRITVSFTEDLNQKIELEAYYKALPKSAVIRFAVMEHFSPRLLIVEKQKDE